MSDTFVFPTPPWPIVSGVEHGTDLSCYLRTVSLPLPGGGTYTATTFDLAADMGEVSGRLGFGEACARRLVTYAGTLLDDPDYGKDLRQYLNDDIDRRALAMIASDAAAELLKDERCVHADAEVAFLSGVLTISIRVFDAKGLFRLTLTVDGVTVAVLLTGLT